MSIKDSGELERTEPTNPIAGYETDEKTRKRARWEAFEFRVPAEGRVRVENGSHGEESGEHVHVVSVEHGMPVACTCASFEYRVGACKHAVAVGDQPAVLMAASESDR